MAIEITSARWQRIINVYLGLLALVTVAYGVLNVRVAPAAAIGDWLINYAGGFVRRGLTGELCLRLGALLHVSPMWLALLLQLICYGFIFYGFYLFSRMRERSWWVLALIFSPATIAFQVMVPTGGFRKEILFFCLLIALMLVLKRRPNAGLGMSLAIAVVVSFIFLSHEGQICFFPYLMAVCFIRTGSVKRSVLLLALPAVCTVLIAQEARTHIGSAATANQICAAIVHHPVATEGKPPAVCALAVTYMGYSQEDSRNELRAFIVGLHYGQIYSITGVLSLLPVVMGVLWLWRARPLRSQLLALLVCMALAWLASVPLFLNAYDWGRWIYIHVMCTAFLLFDLEGTRQREGITVEGAGPVTSAMPVPALLALIVYATLWDMPHVPIYPARFGYPGLVNYVLHYKSSHGGQK